MLNFAEGSCFEMNDFSTIIIAEALDEKMKSSYPVAFHKLCGKTLAEYIYNAAVKGGSKQTFVVGGDFADKAVKIFDEKKLAGSLSQAVQLVDSKYVIVMYGDIIPPSAKLIQEMLSYHAERKTDVTVVKSADGSDAGIYVSEVGLFENIQAEEFFFNNAENISVYESEDAVCRINDRVHLMNEEKKLQKLINENHMRNGVTIHAPETVLISPDAVIGCDTEIYPNVVIEGKTVIGNGVTISSTSKIVNSVIGDCVDIQSSVILDSEINCNTTVGPFAYIRPGCVVGSDVRVGDFVELKNAKIGNGTKISHLTYVGDSDVGEKCNFGCGTVTVNYDGKKKYRTTIGNNVFIGCNSNLVAPVTLKDGAYTAAGSTITDEVPENTLAIARARQINKDVWKDRRK